VHLLPTSTEAPGGYVTGGEVMAFDSKWNLITHSKIKDNKMDVAKGRQL
jgi:hypothetical protein